MDLKIVESAAMLRKRNFVKSVDAEMTLFQRPYSGNPRNLACIIRDMIANLDQLPEINHIFQRGSNTDQPLSPARWHSTNTRLSTLGILGTEPAYFPQQQALKFKLK